MRSIHVGVIGTGWCGGIRAETCRASPLVKGLHVAEIDERRLGAIADKTRPDSATTDYKKLLARADLDAVMICATPESTHHPMAKESLRAAFSRRRTGGSSTERRNRIRFRIHWQPRHRARWSHGDFAGQRQGACRGRL